MEVEREGGRNILREDSLPIHLPTITALTTNNTTWGRNVRVGGFHKCAAHS